MSQLPESATTVLPEDVDELLYDHYEAYVFTPGEGGDGKGISGSGIDFKRAVEQIRAWLEEGYKDVRLTGIWLPRDERAWHVLLDTRNGIDHLGLLGEATMVVERPWLLSVQPGRRERASGLAERAA